MAALPSLTQHLPRHPLLTAPIVGPIALMWMPTLSKHQPVAFSYLCSSFSRSIGPSSAQKFHQCTHLDTSHRPSRKTQVWVWISHRSHTVRCTCHAQHTISWLPGHSHTYPWESARFLHWRTRNLCAREPKSASMCPWLQLQSREGCPCPSKIWALCGVARRWRWLRDAWRSGGPRRDWESDCT